MKTTAIATLLAAASFAAAGAEEAPEGAETETSSPFSFEATLDVLSDYIWRGAICNGNPVWQPGATATFDADDLGSVSAAVRSGFDATHKRGTKATWAKASTRSSGEAST